MKKTHIGLIFLIIAFLPACELILGPDPDTSPEGILFSLWNDFNNVHAYLDIRMSNNSNSFTNWYDVYHNRQRGYARLVYQGMSEEALFNVCARMLGELNDSHVGLYAPGKFASSYRESRDDFDIYTVRTSLIGSGNDKYKNFVYGTFRSDASASCTCIGYIHIESFVVDYNFPENNAWDKKIDEIIKNLTHTKALVLDIRDNRGGDVFAMEYIVSRFAVTRKDYLKTSIKSGSGPNDYSSVKTHTIHPARSNYHGPVVLITNKNSVSAAERFTLALRTQDNVTHIGTATRGALSIRSSRPMINGWFYSISAEKVTDMSGKYYEGLGIAPKEEHIVEYGTGAADNQLKYAKDLAATLCGCVCGVP